MKVDVALRHMAGIYTCQYAFFWFAFFPLFLALVNTLFRTHVAARKTGGKARSAGHSGPMASFATWHSRFSCATRGDGMDFAQPIVTRRIQRSTLPRGYCLVLGEI